MQNRGPGVGGTGMEGFRGLDSDAGSRAGSNAGGTGGVDRMHDEGARGGPGGAGMMPGTAAPGLGVAPAPADPNVAAGPRKMGGGGFGAMGGATGPFARQDGVTGTRMEARTGPSWGRFGADGAVFPSYPSPEVIRQREKERRKAWKARRGPR